MVKAYLRYGHAQSFGVVGTSSCNAVSNEDGSVVYVGGLENVHGWNVRQGNLVCIPSACC
jgi:hypothetical protein